MRRALASGKHDTCCRFVQTLLHLEALVDFLLHRSMSEMVVKGRINHKGPCAEGIMTCNFCQDILRGPLYHFIYLFSLHNSILLRAQLLNHNVFFDVEPIVQEKCDVTC